MTSASKRRQSATPTVRNLPHERSRDIFSLEGKTAVVTGTSAGLGVRLARTLVLAGARVAAIARRRTELDELAMSTGRVLPITADLAEADQVRAAADTCLGAFDGRVDILVNNAAYLAAGVKAEDESYSDIRRTWPSTLRRRSCWRRNSFQVCVRRAAAQLSTSLQSLPRSVSAASRKRYTPPPKAAWKRLLVSGQRNGAATASGSTALRPVSSKPR